MLILAQFLLRAAWGLAAAMAITSPKKVTSGFYRNHSYVLLGMCALAALASYSAVGRDDDAGASLRIYLTWPAAVAALMSYCSSVAWLYEKRSAGRMLLILVAGAALFGAFRGVGGHYLFQEANRLDLAQASMHAADPAVGGLLLGSTLAAMFLGHWYLNTPTMELAPLRRLVMLMFAAALARALFCAAGLAGEIWWFYTSLQPPRGPLPSWPFLALRWLAGILGPIVLGIMTAETLKIPNTQSATGILYVAVIVVFIGELTSLLLSAHAGFPL